MPKADKKPKTRVIGNKDRPHTAFHWKKKKIEAHKKQMEAKEKK